MKPVGRLSRRWPSRACAASVAIAAAAACANLNGLSGGAPDATGPTDASTQMHDVVSNSDVAFTGGDTGTTFGDGGVDEPMPFDGGLGDMDANSTPEATTMDADDAEEAPAPCLDAAGT